MKKILSLLLLMLLCTTAWATEVTLAYPGGTTTNMTGGNDAATLGLDATKWSVVGYKGGSSNYPGLNKDGTIRLYYHANGNSYITVSSLAGATINSINITFGALNNANVLVGGNVVAANGDGSYTINATSFVVINANTESVQVHIKSIVIDYTSDETAVLAPTILLNGEAPASSYYVSELPLSLTITSNNGTETPYYEYTFTDPDGVTSTIRGNATELIIGDDDVLNLKMGSNTLWVAEALQDSETEVWTASPWASATFTIKEDPTTVANIAALTQLGNGTEFSMTGDAVVAYVNGGYLYVKDDSGYTLIYNSTADGIAAGNTISNLKGVVSIYKNLFEVTSATYDVEATSVAVEPVVMTIPDITATNMNQYVKVEGVTLTGTPSASDRNFTMSNGTNTFAGYWRFDNVAYPTDLTKTYDVTGFVAVFNENVQIYPTSIDLAETPVEFGITVTPATGDYTEPVTVTITPTGVGENEEVLITYNLKEEATPLTYDGPFTLYETTTVTVEAMNEAGTIKQWSGTYNITLPALKLKVTPGAGTYTEAQTVTASVEGTTYGDGDDDIEWMWEFTPASNAKTAAEGEGATVTVDESGTLHFLGIETISGREVEGDFVYVIDANYQPAKYQLVTGTNDLIAGKNYLIVATSDDYTYAMSEQRNNNRGASAETIAADGTITPSENARIIKLEGETNAWYLKVSSDVDGGYLYAAASNSNHLKTEQTQSVNSKAAITFENGVTSIVFHKSSNRNVLQFNLNTTNGVSNPIFACYASASQKPVVLYKEVEAGTTYTITPDKAPGAYDGMVLVKPVVDPALPEGAKIYYTFTEGTAKAEGETEVPATGVKLTKSGTLTFIARDADNAELARSESLAYTINSLFGDLNGDGEVDVADVNILVNIILGTYHPNN